MDVGSCFAGKLGNTVKRVQMLNTGRHFVKGARNWWHGVGFWGVRTVIFNLI